MNAKSQSTLYYSGMLVSSIGSMTFNLCIISFLIMSGFGLIYASLIIGLQRIAPILVTGIFGDKTDELSSRGTVFWCEVVAGISAFLILISWHGHATSFGILLSLCLVRSIAISFQLGSRSKIAKLLSDGTYESNSSHAIWLNRASQGATLFAGVIAWPIIKYSSFKVAVTIDCLTFLLNGAAIFLLPIQNEVLEKTKRAISAWHLKFRDLFYYNRRAAIMDIFLAISMMGTISYIARLAGNDQSWSAVFLAAYGISVWVAGNIESAFASKISPVFSWALLAIGFLLLSIYPQMGWFTFGFCLVKDFAYWLLFHRISAHIQHDTPREKMGAVYSARMTIMTIILGTGELLVGAWSKFMPVWGEGLWRALLVLCVCGVLAVTAAKEDLVCEKAAL